MNAAAHTPIRHFEDVQPRKRSRCASVLGLCIIAVFVLGVGLISTKLQATEMPHQVDHVGDNSDWWTGEQILRHIPSADIQARDPGATNFKIAGVNLGSKEFELAASKLGRSPIIERQSQDGHYRRQVCYASRQASGTIYLIFEESFMQYSAYIFVDGSDWDGKQYCTDLPNPSGPLGPDSGLRVGQSPNEVLAILGKPSFHDDINLFYSFGVDGKKASKEELTEAQTEHPELSSSEVEEQFGTYDLGAVIYARFDKSRLAYLWVERSETN